jgi:hypothetical protein
VRPYLKKSYHKKKKGGWASGVAQGVGTEFKSSTVTKKKKERERERKRKQIFSWLLFCC